MREKVNTWILSGILFTLLGMAYQAGQVAEKIEMTFSAMNDHEKRIIRIEGKVFP